MSPITAEYEIEPDRAGGGALLKQLTAIPRNQAAARMV